MAEITVDATLENLDVVLDFVNKQMEQADCPVKLMTQLDIAVEEIYVNIAHYACHPEIGSASIHCEVTGEPLRISIEFLDSGKPYNLLEKEDPDVQADISERQIGGLGIFMVKTWWMKYLMSLKMGRIY